MFVAVAALATLVPPVPSPPAGAAGRPGGPLVPASGFYVGAYSKPVGGYGQARVQAATNDLESRLGRRLHINHHFYAWQDAFPSWREPWDIEHDRIPMISWNGEDTDAINQGAWDGLIAARAQAVAALGVPVFIRWFWEMDGNKKQGYISSPSSYQKAWRHIHDIFRANGAGNAVWVWCPNASAVAKGNGLEYYPGPEYVDWVCGDGYNFNPVRPGDEWETFAEIYGDFYAAATKLGKPIMIGEFGVLERRPGEKEHWFRQAHDWVQHRPAIAALVYFNADSTTKDIYYNWRVDTSPSAFEGFRYLFTGLAPVPPGTERPPAPPPSIEPPAPPADETSPTPRRKSRPPEGSAPTGSTEAPGPSFPGEGTRPGPSARLTWVLELLRQLDAAAVAT